MQVKQQSPTHTPSLFYLPRPTGEFKDIYDENGDVIGQEEIIVYDLEYEDKSADFASGKSLRRKCKAGYQDCHVYEDAVHIFKNDVEVFSYQLAIQRWRETEQDWQTLVLPLDDMDVTDGVINARKTQGAFTAHLWIDMTMKGQGQWRFRIDAPGELLRVGWRITLVDQEDMKLDFSDYTGNVQDDEGDPVRTILFEPEGKLDFLEI